MLLAFSKFLTPACVKDYSRLDDGMFSSAILVIRSYVYFMQFLKNFQKGDTRTDGHTLQFLDIVRFNALFS